MTVLPAGELPVWDKYEGITTTFFHKGSIGPLNRVLKGSIFEGRIGNYQTGPAHNQALALLR